MYAIALLDKITSLNDFLKPLMVRYIGRMANKGNVWIFTITITKTTYKQHFTKPKKKFKGTIIDLVTKLRQWRWLFNPLTFFWKLECWDTWFLIVTKDLLEFIERFTKKWIKKRRFVLIFVDNTTFLKTWVKSHERNSHFLYFESLISILKTHGQKSISMIFIFVFKNINTGNQFN